LRRQIWSRQILRGEEKRRKGERFKLEKVSTQRVKKGEGKKGKRKGGAHVQRHAHLRSLNSRQEERGKPIKHISKKGEGIAFLNNKFRSFGEGGKRVHYFILRMGGGGKKEPGGGRIFSQHCRKRGRKGKGGRGHWRIALFLRENQRVDQATTYWRYSALGPEGEKETRKYTLSSTLLAVGGKGGGKKSLPSPFWG